MAQVSPPEPQLPLLPDLFIKISDPIDQNHWFLSPDQHAVEFVLAILLAIALLRAAKRVKPQKSSHTRCDTKPLSLVGHIIRLVLTINLSLQLYYKTAHGWRFLAYFLQPCHICSALYLYCLYTSNYEGGKAVFNISLHYLFFTTLALAVPDLSELTLFFEQTNFFLQHWFLVFAPLYILITERFPVEGVTCSQAARYYYYLSAAFAAIVHFAVQLPVAFMVGVNVNYMLWAPPESPFPFDTKLYRLCFCAGFVVLFLLCGYLLPLAIIRTKRALGFAPQTHHTKGDKQHKTS